MTKSAIQRRLAAQSGYTLIELIVVLALSIVVVGLPMDFIVNSLKDQNVSASRAAAASKEEIGMARLTRDLREALPSITAPASPSLTWGSSSASVTLTLPVPGTAGATTESVAWSCSFSSAGTGTCTRSVNAGTAVRELTNVVGLSFSPIDQSGNALGGSSSPFTATNSSSAPIAYVGITAKVLVVSQLDPSSSTAVHGVTNPITLQDGVAILNNQT